MRRADRPVEILMCLFAVLLAAAMVGLGAESLARADDVLNPKTYASPSGRYELFVDPSNMEGKGPGSYRISHDGAVIWKGEKPFTLRDAAITDDGLIVGYAYEGGVFSGGHHGTQYSGLAIIIMDASGETLLRDLGKSHPTGAVPMDWSGSDSPAVAGMIVDALNDRSAICITEYNTPLMWWNYRLSTRAPTGDATTARPATGARSIPLPMSVRHIADTPLTIIHWYERNEIDVGQEHNAILSVVDASGAQVWATVFAGEYDALSEHGPSYADLERLAEHQLEPGQNTFAFRSLSNSARFKYAVVTDPAAPTGWRVDSAGLEPDRLPTIQEVLSPQPPESIELEYVGVIELAPRQRTDFPFDNLFDFQIDAEGHIGLFADAWKGPVQFLLFSATGEMLADHTLAIPKVDRADRRVLSPCGPDRWIIIQQDDSEPVESSAWWLNPATGVLAPIDGFEVGTIESIHPNADAGIDILVEDGLYLDESGIARFDQDAGLVWHRGGPDIDPDAFSLDSIAPLSDGRLAVLLGSDRIVLLGRDGRTNASIEVEKLIGVEPNYPADVFADVNGGFVFHDFGGAPPLYRVNSDLKVVSRFTPRYADGTPIDPLFEIRPHPDGSLWTHDRHRLLRLNAKGVVDRVIGRGADDDTLIDVESLSVDRQGFLYAINPRTRAVHAFDMSGREISVVRPEPVDAESGDYPNLFTAWGEGNVLFTDFKRDLASAQSQHPQLPEGDGSETYQAFFIDSDAVYDVHFEPNSLKHWTDGFHSIRLVDPAKGVRKEITRRLDGHWLNVVYATALGHNNSLAVISGPDMWSRGRGDSTLSIFDANGEPRRCIALRHEDWMVRVALTDRFAMTVAGDFLNLYDLTQGDDAEPKRFTIPRPDSQPEGAYWAPFISPDGTEIWLHPSSETRVYRYRLP